MSASSSKSKDEVAIRATFSRLPTAQLQQSTRRVIQIESPGRKRTCDDFCRDIVAPNRNKIMFSLFNVCFIALGLIYLYYGIYFWIYGDLFDPDNHCHLNALIAVIILTGIAVISASVLGTVGFFMYKLSFLKCTMGIHVLAAFALLGIALHFGRYLPYKTEVVSRRYLEEMYYQYHRDEKARATIDSIQKRLKCCGIQGSRTFPRDEIPASCCSTDEENCKALYVYESACHARYKTFLDSKFTESTWITAFLCVLHVIAIAAVFFPFVIIKKQIPDEPVDHPTTK